MSEPTKKKRGRPKKEDAMTYNYRLRMSEDIVDMINYIQENEGQTTADILRNGVRIQFNLSKSKH